MFPPFVVAFVDVVVLWFVWDKHYPRSAGQALAVAEGAAAAYHVKNGRRMLGAMTGAGAISQWLHSSTQPPTDGHLAPPSRTTGPSAAPLAQALTQLAALHAQGSLSDEEFALAKKRLLSPAQSPTSQRVVGHPPGAHTSGPSS